jgi:hypothetical protein
MSKSYSEIVQAAIAEMDAQPQPVHTAEMGVFIALAEEMDRREALWTSIFSPEISG